MMNYGMMERASKTLRRSFEAEAGWLRHRRIRARGQLAGFIRYTMPSYEFSAHHFMMIDEIEAAIAAKDGRLYIGMPPRHGKSETGTIRTICWHVGRYPAKQVMLLCHSQDLANEFSRRIREIVRDDPRFRDLFPAVALHPERARINDWKTTAGGGLKAVGVGGGITGHGADLTIIDDPHKEGDAESMFTLDQVFDWYATAARTRLAPGASVIFIMTRWHLLDLAGRLLELQRTQEYADKWREVVLPALAGPDDLLGRAEGEALWPDRFSRESLLALKALDDRHFQALYQNNPRGADDVMFDIEKVKWIERAPAGPRFWTCDFATSKSETSDYTVLARWASSGKRLYLLQSHRFRANYSEVRRRLRDIAGRDRVEKIVFPKDLLELLMFQDLRSEIGGANLTTVAMKGDKVQKAQHPATLVNNKRLSVVRDTGSDNDYFVRELGEFPMGRYDDCVDAMSVAAHYIGVPSEIQFFLSGGADA